MIHAKTSFIGAILLSTLALPKGYAQTHIPDGYREGRENAVEGTYHTVMSDGAKPYQERALDLEKHAYGLAKLANQSPIKQSEQIYLLENQIIRLNLDVANAAENEMTPFERSSLLLTTVRTYGIVRTNAERIFEDMIRFIDIKIPGPSGKQTRTEISDFESMYEANYRVDQDLTQAERDTRYQASLAAFEKKGGSVQEIKVLTPELLKSFGPYTRVEYVWLLDGNIRVTEGNAGHVLLAEGKPVKAAGQIVMLKAGDGHFTFVALSNSSGNFKPDMMSVESFSKLLAKKLKIEPELMMLTKGEPMSTQAVKVYLKGEGVAPEMIKNKIAAIEEQALAIRNPNLIGVTRCGTVFN
jgi:hypothetical protein